MQIPVLNEPIFYLGPDGSFSHRAVTKFYPGQDLRPCYSLSEVLKHLTQGQCVFIPVKNTTAGSVPEIEQFFDRNSVNVLARHYLDVRLCLYSWSQSLEQIETIYSHPMIFKQCEQWLTKCLPQAQRCPVDSSSIAIKKAESSPGLAAIGSRGYNTPAVLVIEDIQDRVENITEFQLVKPC